MKNKKLIKQFMKENRIEFKKPFWVKTCNDIGEVKCRIIEEKKWGIPEIEYYSEKEEKWNAAGTEWLLLVMFCENYEIIRPKQKPKDGDVFWYVSKSGNVYSLIYTNIDPNNIALFLIGNCFETKKEAESNREKVLKILRRNEPLIDLKEMQ
mgnify:FL=1